MRHFECNSCIADIRLGAHQALRHGGRLDEEGAPGENFGWFGEDQHDCIGGAPASCGQVHACLTS
jgi:hypothetical protein